MGIKYLLNIRPYSCVDVIVLGFLAKFSNTKNLTFGSYDLSVALAMLALWIFFNLLLERKHNYADRGTPSKIPAIFSWGIAAGTSLLTNPYAIAPAAACALFIFIYLEKNRNSFLGTTNMISRGIIQATYFLFAATLYSIPFNKDLFLLSIIVFLLYVCRGLIADIRDISHNRLANKITLPVNLGIRQTKICILCCLLACIFIQLFYFSAAATTIPLVLYALGIIGYTNSYVLHQLMILTTTYSHFVMIYFFTNQPLILILLIYAGIFLNMVFYPMLARKSNPTFIQQNDFQFLR